MPKFYPGRRRSYFRPNEIPRKRPRDTDEGSDAELILLRNYRPVDPNRRQAHFCLRGTNGSPRPAGLSDDECLDTVSSFTADDSADYCFPKHCVRNFFIRLLTACRNLLTKGSEDSFEIPKDPEHKDSNGRSFTFHPQKPFKYETYTLYTHNSELGYMPRSPNVESLAETEETTVYDAHILLNTSIASSKGGKSPKDKGSIFGGFFVDEAQKEKMGKSVIELNGLLQVDMTSLKLKSI